MGTLGKAALQIGLILLFAGLGTAWTYHHNPKRPALYLTPELPPSNSIALSKVLAWEKPPVWIDARPHEDFRIAQIPGALSLHPENAETQMKQHFDLFIDQRKVFVIYGPEKDAQAIATRLAHVGLHKLHVLEGGWPAWQAQHP
ncbi:MAG: rhodanese-related sulfurtransferase [Verrucomicrobiales bacterium]|jgi:rhodanese-related sulfurtransferase